MCSGNVAHLLSCIVWLRSCFGFCRQWQSTEGAHSLRLIVALGCPSAAGRGQATVPRSCGVFGSPLPSTEQMSKQVFIVAAKRTAFGTFGGALKNVTATELGAAVS